MDLALRQYSEQIKEGKNALKLSYTMEPKQVRYWKKLVRKAEEKIQFYS